MLYDCAMKSSLVFTITVILCMYIKPVVGTQKETVYCVMPSHQNVTGLGGNTANCTNHTKWTSILFNTSRYFMSYTKLYFFPGTYNLRKHLQINNVQEFSIIGDKEVTIVCPTNTNNVSLFISNSLSVEVRSVKFENCKMNMQNIQLLSSNNLSTSTSAAMFVYNVNSLIITNISFENCYCYGIAGFNMLGSLQDISIFYTYKSDVHKHGNSTVGGFLLVYFDDGTQIHDYKNIQEVLIDDCMIFDILNTASSSFINRSKKSIDWQLHTSVIGIGFYQQSYFVKVKLLNVVIKNVTINKGPVVMIVYSSIINSVYICNSSFTQIVSKQQPLISIRTISSKTNVIESSANFTLIHCNIMFSTAVYVMHVLQPFKYVPMKLNITVCYTEFKGNRAGSDFWKMKLMKTYQTHVAIYIVKSNFESNTGFTLWFFYVSNVTFIGNNRFYNNSVKSVGKAMIRCNGTLLIFKGYNEFSRNTANEIISLVQKYIGLHDNATITFLQNKALNRSKQESMHRSVIKFKKTMLTFYLCLFQFFSKSENLDEDFMNNKTDVYFNVTFKGNTNYNSTIFGTQMNSCYWDPRQSAFMNLSPGYVYKRVLHFNVASEKITSRVGPTFCYCESADYVDCMKDHFGPIYPGQAIPISLKQAVISDKSTPASAPLVDRYFIPTFSKLPNCELVPLYEKSDRLVQVIYVQCVPLLYRVLNNNVNTTACSAYFSDTTTNNWYSVLYFVSFNKACPLGFENYIGFCECNKQLKAAIPSLTCDIKTQGITLSGRHGWIGLSSNQQNILYVKQCYIFCRKMSTTILLEFPDAQCNYNRTGIMCGQCSPGLDAMFGSFDCQKCSNYWLLLILVFMLAGILLVMSLFVLNLTVVDGKLNGFILYINLIAGNAYTVFPSKGNIFFVLTSLFNLDLGIETCFYHGMTEYDKTWLQFAFPTYLLVIVAVLTIASRYSSLVEKITRKRVIPVIATIFLLSYNKLLLTTAKVLCSYRTIHSLPDNEDSVIWFWDTGTPLVGIKFLTLLTVCLLVFLMILLPFNLLLLFTKFSYRFRFVAEYLKPYLDAYQAPFKNNCYYYFGIELLLRPIAFAIGNRLLDSHKTVAIAAFLCITCLLYLCIVRPFKSRANMFLYVSYLFNATCLVLLVMYFNIKITKFSYEVLYNSLIFIALIQFGGTVFYYLYITHLCKVKQLKNCFEKTKVYLLECWNKWKCNEKETRCAPNALPLENFEQLQEELLIADPTH